MPEPAESSPPPGDDEASPLRVLLVHDSIEKSLLMQRELRKSGYWIAVRRVGSGEEMRAALADETFDIVLSAYELQQFGAVDALSLLGRSGADIPFVVIAGRIGEEAVATLMRLGANDFVHEDHLDSLMLVVDRQLKQRAARVSRHHAQEALALASEHLLRETGAQARTFKALHEVAITAGGLLEPEVLARLTVDHASTLLGVDGAVVYGWDEAAQLLRPLYETESAASEPPIKSGEGAVGIAFATGRPQVIDNYQTWEGAISQSARRGMVSAVAVPLVAQDRPIGALGVWTYTHRPFTPDQVEVLSLFAAQIAPGLEAARLHAHLAESEERFRRLNDTIACGVTVQNPDGEIVVANEAALDILGLRRDELVGRRVAGLSAVLTHEDGRPLSPADSPSSVVLRTQQPVRNFRLGMHREGQPPLWLQVDSVPVLNREGELKQVVTSFIDITQTRLAEDARRENEAKSRFLATMSHELRTPLNSILGFAQLLTDSSFGELNERQLRYLGHIDASGRHLLSLINDVLDLSKVVAGQMKVEMVQLDAAEVIATTIAELKPLAEGKALKVNLETAEVIPAMADKRRLHQVALNLMSNAIKFTPPMGKITVFAARSGDEVRISVQDTGPGIPAEEQERIFEEFTQVDSGPARHQEGTGLGLALSRRLMELMGGTLTLQSRPGEGSTFTMTLKAGASAAAEVVAQEQVGSGALHR